MTSGTASPSACGQAMTSTVTSRSTANERSRRAASQTTRVTAPDAEGDDGQPERGAVGERLRRDRELCACSTSRMMPASAVCSPVPVTSTRSEPAPFTVPAMTRSPGCLWHRRDFARDHRLVHLAGPSRTTPSAGMLAPGRTSTRSPSRSAEIGTSSIRSSAARYDSSRGVGQELGELGERALRLR